MLTTKVIQNQTSLDLLTCSKDCNFCDQNKILSGKRLLRLYNVLSLALSEN